MKTTAYTSQISATAVLGGCAHFKETKGGIDMIVTKHGNFTQREGKCDRCGCEFLFERKDCYWDSPKLTYILECPECGNEIWLGDIFDK